MAVLARLGEPSLDGDVAAKLGGHGARFCAREEDGERDRGAGGAEWGAGEVVVSWERSPGRGRQGRGGPGAVVRAAWPWRHCGDRRKERDDAFPENPLEKFGSSRIGPFQLLF